MKPLVSICCVTYNHEEYIAEALESFLMQETAFSYEIIIHDDLSTDNTIKIIKEYKDRYPDKIKLILQKENQYSQGKKILYDFLVPNARGKYIALCEGDDYWNNKHKIQTQVDFMERQIGYSACFHAVETVTTTKKFLGRYLGPYGLGSRDYQMKDNVQGGFIHLSSLLIDREYLDCDIPNWAIRAKHGDFALALFLSAVGKVSYIDENMSSHRVGVQNSVMTKMNENSTKKRRIEYIEHRKSILKDANEYYNYKFNDHLKDLINDCEVRIVLIRKGLIGLFDKTVVRFILNNGKFKSVKFLIITIYPNLASKLSRLKSITNK